MNEVELYLYRPRHAALAVLATLRAKLPRTEERQISAARVVLCGDLGDQAAQTLRDAWQHVQRLHPNWRDLIAVTALDRRRAPL